MLQKPVRGRERREYIRMDSVFPVEFRLIDPVTRATHSDVLQGFTSNISKTGICLAVPHLDSGIAHILKQEGVQLSLAIEMPLGSRPVAAIANVAWARPDTNDPRRLLIGIKYVHIDPEKNKRMFSYVRFKSLVMPVLVGVISSLVLALALGSLVNLRLRQENNKLINQLFSVTKETTAAKDALKIIDVERAGLEKKIAELKKGLESAEEDKARLASSSSESIDRLTALIRQLSNERQALQNKLKLTVNKEITAAGELKALEKKKETLEKANLDKIYQWLKVHQNHRSGLVASFEGDDQVEGWAFTYDQALAAQAYTYSGDYERARKIFDFYSQSAQRQQGMFLNAYYVDDASPAEYLVHSGPNIWMGIAVMHYINKAKDNKYLDLAQAIAEAIMRLQDESQDGGIRGGPQVSWYSTEHNLDAYAFLGMLYKTTGDPRYRGAQEKVLNWLVENTYAKNEIPIKRGKGDSTIATDTYAWSIASIGPKELERVGMNPDKIMQFAEDHCRVEVAYNRPDGQTLTIKGFDFAPKQHTGRGGVVSSEWTAQMVLSFKIMADFYRGKEESNKALDYDSKAREYLDQLARMIISSPSASGQGENCLPYATQGMADTGHGWMTPQGSRTGSVAGTAYTFFAYYNYNPLDLKE